MTDEITIAELVRHKTLSAEMAGLLWAAVDEKVSFLTSALYRNAGKTTVSKAALSLLDERVPRHYVADSVEITEKLLSLEKPGGYLIVEEFSPADVPGYIWGEKIQHVFNMLKKGYSLQASLHAENAKDAIYQITNENGISDEDASFIKLVLHIEMFGTSPSDAKRRVSEMFEVHYVENGEPVGHTLYVLNKNDDTFEKTDEPHEFARNKEELKKRTEIIYDLANSGRTSPDDVAKAVGEFMGK